MKTTRSYSTRDGATITATIEFHGADVHTKQAIEDAITRLVMRARKAKTKRAVVGGGLVVVTVTEEPAR